MGNVIDIVVRAKDATAGAWKKVAAKAKKLSKTVKKSMKAIGGVAKAAAVGIIAIGAAFIAVAKRAEEFNKQVGQIATLADVSTGAVKKQIRGMSAEFGLAKDELTKGLYDALSAGVPKENAFEFLRVAAKGAIAGAATTGEAVDILTTALNAFGIPASEAESVSDALFTTVKLGKTTLSELSESFAQVGPIASASGVKIEEVLAATATLTKQGTPPAQAMTQIRAAIISMNDKLGDGWTETMTLQEGMIAMRDAAGGSTTKLKEMTGRVEGMLGILALTGEKAQGAAEDLAVLGAAAGATDQAFGEMDKVTVLSKIVQAFDNVILKLGDETFAAFGSKLTALGEKIQEFSESGQIEIWAENVKAVMAVLIPIFSKVFGLIGNVFNATKDAVQSAGAFVGALSGGASFKEAGQAAKFAPEKADQNKKQRLAAIQAEEAAKEAAAEADKKRATATAATEEKIRAAKAKTIKAADKQRRNEEAAAKAKTKADAKAAKTAEKRLAIAAKLAAAEKKLTDVAKQDHVRGFEKAAQDNEENIGEIQKKIAGIAGNREERRAAELEQRQVKRDDDRELELKKRVARRGTTLGKDDAAFLLKRKLEKDLKEQQDLKAENEDNADKLKTTIAQDQRQEMITELQRTRDVLEKNLQAV